MNNSNLDKWRLYCRHIPSPDSFIDFGFYFMISAALQRRVWLGGTHKPLFFNQYVGLCGPPATGKGMILDPIKQFLTYHKAYVQKGLEDVSDLFYRKASDITTDKNIVTAGPAFFNRDYAKDAANGHDFKKSMMEPLMFPMANDTTTFQAFIAAFIDSMAFTAYKDDEGKVQKMMYCSLFSCLDELSSLFQMDDKKIARFIIKIYDCGDATYDTKARKVDMIKNVCFNMISGVTPDYIRDIMDEGVLNEGWNSRMWYVYEAVPRFQTLLMPELNVDQKLAKAELLEHLRLLSKVRGQAKLSQEAQVYAEKWWREFPKQPKANASSKLADYYGRKNIHALKLAGAIHFSNILDVNDKVISLNSFMRALNMLDSIEKNMHLALSYSSRNPLADVANKVTAILKVKGFQTFMQLFDNLITECRRSELDEVIGNLQTLGKIEQVKSTDGTLGYKLKAKPATASQPLIFKS